MVTSDLVFWLASLPDLDPVVDDAPINVLCQRHADAMVVPRGWTLDDRREADLHLFNIRSVDAADAGPTPRRRRSAPRAQAGEQLQIDGTGPIERPELVPSDSPADSPDDAMVDASEPPADSWSLSFDTDDDLDGLLDVSSPLLSRAFRGDRRGTR